MIGYYKCFHCGALSDLTMRAVVETYLLNEQDSGSVPLKQNVNFI